MIGGRVQRFRIHSAVFLLCAAGLAAGCAVQEAPQGGPEDKTPPGVVSTVPAPDSAGVSRDVSPVITFSEKVDPGSFRSRVVLFPPVAFEKLGVKGDRLEITFKEELPDTTLCLLLRPGIRDYHRVESTKNYLLYFATAPTLAPGEISGTISFKDKPDSTGVAELFAVPRDTAFNIRTAQRARVAFAAGDGSFDLRGLPVDGSRFFLRVFNDRDGDSRYSEGKEFATLDPDTLRLDPLRPRIEDLRLTIIDPNEPGSVTGSVVDETGFARPPMVRLSPAGTDRKALAVRADSTGAFRFPAVPPGPYLCSAFIDLKPDSLCGTYPAPEDSTVSLSEPCVTLPDTLRVGPGEAMKLPPLTLK
jgi:hypothetical protein